MVIHWKTQCAFMFESWSTDNQFVLVIGAILSGIIAFITIAFPAYRKILKKLIIGGNQEQQSQQYRLSTKENLFYFFYYAVYSILHIASMMLIMTMNGVVLCFLFLGYSLAFCIYGFECDRDKTLPVNCCA